MLFVVPGRWRRPSSSSAAPSVTMELRCCSGFKKRACRPLLGCCVLVLRLSKVLCDVSFTIGRRLRLWSSSAIGSGRGLLFGIFLSLASAGGRAACRRSALNVRSGCFCCCRLGLREVLPFLLHLSAYWLDPRCLCEDCRHRL